MKKKIIGMATLVLIGGLTLNCATGSAIYHGGLMKGSVISATGNEGVICIGSKDGAEVGQVWNTVRIETQGTGKTSKFIWVPSGSVKIVEIIDEHFAKVSVVDGKLEKGYVAELQPK